MAEEKTTELQEATPMRVVSPFDEMDRLFDRLLARRGWMRPWRTDWPSLGDVGWVEPRLPRIDIVDREDDIVMRAEVPGIEKKELDISVGEDSVTLHGETRHEEKEDAGDLYRCEISRGAFSRTVGLPAAASRPRPAGAVRSCLRQSCGSRILCALAAVGPPRAPE